ncbi:MAG: AAA family ATPase, partial [Planctomycetota bacterium]
RDEPCTILIETQPTLRNLLGTIERQVLPGGGAYSDHTMIRAGSLLRADGGYLVLETRDVLTEPGAWKVLVRTLRTGRLEIAAQESLLFGSTAMVKPEPIPVNLKVILIGDPGLYRVLDANDPDFPDLFKVLADFDSVVPRDAEGVHFYAGALAALVEAEHLPHFAADAIAALVEHGARIAGRRDRLSTRLGRLADVAREAAFLTRKSGQDLVSGDDVLRAVKRSRRRADLPARRFRQAIAEGTIRIQMRGRQVGQINGLAVTSAGPLTYGFPARITATIAPGTAGTINIEREAQLSGSIHTKGFYILGGLLRHLLSCAGHPLAFSASIAFEQSYGGIDGDSASGAEMCCLLSVLTGVALDQGLAMTGAIDQLGNMQPIGAASEKIEGYFDACFDAGLTGDQGVILPAANLHNLMLRQDVVEACENGQFRVWGVHTIHEALEIFTGCDAGEVDAETGRYTEGSLLARAVERAGKFWRMTRGLTPLPEEGEEEEQEEEESLDAIEGEL